VFFVSNLSFKYSVNKFHASKASRSFLGPYVRVSVNYNLCRRHGISTGIQIVIISKKKLTLTK